MAEEKPLVTPETLVEGRGGVDLGNLEPILALKGSVFTVDCVEQGVSWDLSRPSFYKLAVEPAVTISRSELWVWNKCHLEWEHWPLRLSTILIVQCHVDTSILEDELGGLRIVPSSCLRTALAGIHLRSVKDTTVTGVVVVRCVLR